MNKITSYIDGSVVYGESEERNRALREFKDGKMKVEPGDLIPVSNAAIFYRKNFTLSFVIREEKTKYCTILTGVWILALDY